jgi:hypothetical protein
MATSRKLFLNTSLYSIHAIILFLLVPTLSSFADDSAASVTPEGLQFKPMKEVSVEREDLYIDNEKVEVTMTFLNTSAKDISSIVAFPIPDYKFSPPEGIAEFNDFSVEVDGKVINYQTEVRAFVDGKECTKILKDMKFPIADLEASRQYFLNLSEKDRISLINRGIVDTTYFPDEVRWTVWKKYYWQQTFPANKTITIKHRYTPYAGSQYFRNETKDIAYLKNTACLDKKYLTIIKKSDPEALGGITWVSYILKSALNWKQPMKIFHLTVQKYPNDIFSTCFNHPFKQTDSNTYELSINNFVPDSDITVYFIRVPKKGEY